MDYISVRGQAPHARVIVTVGLHKRTEQVTVLIRNLDTSSPTEFTSSLEEAITAALAARFSAKSIDVGRGAVGPELGP